MSQGWVKLHRQIEENELYFLEPFTKAQAWIDIFLNANHEDGKFQVRGNIVTVKRGQLGWSELTMMARWGWSKNKVRRFLKYLETKQQIVQQKTFITTLITVLNYEEYQGEKENTIQQTIQQKDSRRYTNKNDNNDKNEKKESESRRFTPPTLKEVSDYCIERSNEIDPHGFIDYYTSKGWKVGNSTMKDWKSAVRTWERRDNQENSKKSHNQQQITLIFYL